MRRIVLSCLPLLLLACDSRSPAGGEGQADHPVVGPLDLVTSGDYTRLVIEIDAVEGKGPAPAALRLFEERLTELVAGGHLDKPGGVDVVIDDALPAHEEEDHEYTLEEQHALSRANRDLPSEPGVAFVHMLYLDGHSELDQGGGSVLGYAYGGSYITMLRENIDGACARSMTLGTLVPALQKEACEVTEAGVLVHELGHLLGLVNNGLAMVTPHQDEDHGAHDRNERCVMYWLAETSDAVDVVADRFLRGETGVVPFDDECLADLASAVDSD